MICMFNLIQHYLQMYLKTLEISALKYMNLILLTFLSAPGLTWHACLKKTGVELELLTDNDVLRMFEKGIRGGMCQALCRYAKANNKCMNNYDKNKESSYLKYLDANNLYGWAMCKKLPVGNFKRLDNEDISKFNDELIKDMMKIGI